MVYEMVRIKVKLGSKGQIVIPKVIRVSMGLLEEKEAVLELKGKVVEIRAFEGVDLVRKARERAKKYGGNLKKLGWVYGDKLYEKEFR